MKDAKLVLQERVDAVRDHASEAALEAQDKKTAKVHSAPRPHSFWGWEPKKGRNLPLAAMGIGGPSTSGASNVTDVKNMSLRKHLTMNC